MKRQYLLLLILPLCFIFLTVSLRLIEGPYFNYGLSDPSYVYLANSLSLAKVDGYAIGHVDHPGTPLQITGAIIIRVFYFFSHEKPDLTEDVLSRAETYLTIIDFTLIFLNAIGLYVMGLIIFNIRKTIITPLFFQTIPFVSINILEVFSIVKPENFIFFIILIFISLMINFVYEENINSEKMFFYEVGIGVLFGFILASKISFVCLIFIPLVLFPGIYRKATFLLASFLSFIIFVLPAISNLSYFINWVGSMFLHEGRYGRGATSILNAQSFGNNIMKIFFNERFFTLVYFLIIVVLILLIVLKKDSKISLSSSSKREIKILTAMFLAMSLQIIFVAKHYSHRYTYPALVLAIPGLYLSIFIMYKRYFSKINANIIFGIIFTGLILFSAYNSRKILSRARMRSNETNMLHSYIQSHYPMTDIILSSGTSNPFVGYFLAYIYSGEKAKEDYQLYINKQFPNQTWYDIWTGKLYSLSESFDVKNVLQPGRPTLYQTTDESFNNGLLENFKTNHNLKDIQLSKVFSNGNGELLFEVINNSR